MEKLNKFFTAAEIAEIDKYTIENEPISSLDLMERASRCWVESFYGKEWKYRSIVVVAGGGNNGGDGYAIARMLKDRGENVVTYQLVEEDGMSPDCRTNYRRFRDAGGKVVWVAEASQLVLGEGMLVVDAIFGTGLNRPVSGRLAEVIGRINASRCRVVAVDMPSGLMGEDNAGNISEAVVQADFTFTFQFPKLAFLLPENVGYVGEWQVLDIGLHPRIIQEKTTSYYYVTGKGAARLMPPQQKFAHKGTNGRGLLVAGEYGMMGAAVLAAKAAVRSGIGLLCCHVPETERAIVHTCVPEALTDFGMFRVGEKEVEGMGKYDAVAIGPGIGKGPEVVEKVKRLLTAWKGTTIIDADALNVLAEHRELLGLLHEGCILTPHVKEFERLAGKCGNDFERLNKLSIFANHYRLHVILKGAHTVTASPGGELYFNMSGNPGMAKGGAGDVLTGVLLALAANGLPPLKVALIGVYAHGMAGDLLAGEWGMRGISAGMLAENMGKAWNELEKIE